MAQSSVADIEPPVASVSFPTTCEEVKKLRKMPALRDVCKAAGISYSGRVSREDLFHPVRQRFGIATSGHSGASSREKPDLPPEICEAYGKLPSFPHVTAGWDVRHLCKMPHFTVDAVKEYLVNSADKEYDGDGLRAYKQLRAYQLFDERHVHDLEGNLWTQDSHFYFVRAKCWPSQGTTKSAYKCIVCIDHHVGRVCSAHCRCVFALQKSAVMLRVFCSLWKIFVREGCVH